MLVCQKKSANGAFRSTKGERHWAVVASKDVGMDRSIVEPLAQTVGDDEVVDAPAGILLTGLEAVGPPRVFHLLRVFVAERISEAAGE